MAETTLSVVPELDICHKTLVPFEAVVGGEGFLAGEMKEVKIGKAF